MCKGSWSHFSFTVFFTKLFCYTAALELFVCICTYSSIFLIEMIWKIMLCNFLLNLIERLVRMKKGMKVYHRKWSYCISLYNIDDLLCMYYQQSWCFSTFGVTFACTQWWSTETTRGLVVLVNLRRFRSRSYFIINKRFFVH